eukprot:gene9334-1421_t
MSNEIEIKIKNMNTKQCSECLKEIIKYFLFNKNQIPTYDFEELAEIKYKVDELKENKKRISLKNKIISKTYEDLQNLFQQIENVFLNNENKQELSFGLYFGSILKPIEIIYLKFHQNSKNEDVKNAIKIILRNLITNQQIFESNLNITKLFFLFQVEEGCEYENFYPKSIKKIDKEYFIQIGESKENEDEKIKIWLISKFSIQGYK